MRVCETAMALGACGLFSLTASWAGHDDRPLQDLRAEFAVVPPAGILAVTDMALMRDGSVTVVGVADLRKMREAHGADQFVCATDGTDVPCSHAFVLVLEPNGTRRRLAALGGDGAEWHVAIAPSADGSVWALISGSSRVVRVGKGRDTAAPPAPCSGTQPILVRLDAQLDRLLDLVCVGGDGASIVSNHLAVAGDGTAWVAGTQCDGTAEVIDAWQPRRAGNCDMYVARFVPGRRRPSLATYVGGSQLDYPTSIAVAPDGDLLIAGATLSRDFPTVRPLMPDHGGVSGANHFDHDGVLVRLDVTGRWLEYSTFLGGKGQDTALGVAVDSAGDVFVVGSTSSGDFLPGTTPLDTSGPTGGDDAFVVAVGSDGELAYSRVFGGSAADAARGVSVLADGSLLLVGQTSSPDFPAGSRRRAADGSGDWDLPFVVRVDSEDGRTRDAVFLALPDGEPAPYAEDRWSNRFEAVAAGGDALYVAGSATSWARRDGDWTSTGTTRYVWKLSAPGGGE